MHARFFHNGAGTPFIGDAPRKHTLRMFRSTLIVEENLEEKIVKNRKPGVTASRV